MSSKLQKLTDALNDGINPEWDGMCPIVRKPSEDGPFHIVDRITYDYLMNQLLHGYPDSVKPYGLLRAHEENPKQIVEVKPV